MKNFNALACITFLCAQLFIQQPFIQLSHAENSIRFPQDEGSHNVINGLEWWYVVFHATGKITGDRYSILVSHFNNQVRFFNVTNLTKKTHVTGSTFGRLKSRVGSLELTHQTKYGSDFLKNSVDHHNNLIPFQYEMETHYQNMNLRAKLRSLKNPLLVGGDGYGPVGSMGMTWYYSLTHLEFEGDLLFDGIQEPIYGIAWMDHQWGPFWVSPIQIGRVFESYEWFSIQLDQGYELMISNIYNRKNELPEDSAYGDVQIMNPLGETKIAKKSEFIRTGYWQDPISKKYFSQGWKLKIAEWNLELTLTPEYENQMVKFPLNGSFWEGSIKVSGTLNGERVSGLSYGELVHYFQIPKLKILSVIKPVFPQDTLRLDWAVLNPDEGNPLYYKISLIQNEKDDLLLGATKNKSILLSIKDLKTHMKSKIKIQACSVDSTLCGEVQSYELRLYQ